MIRGYSQTVSETAAKKLDLQLVGFLKFLQKRTWPKPFTVVQKKKGGGRTQTFFFLCPIDNFGNMLLLDTDLDLSPPPLRDPALVGDEKSLLHLFSFIT